MPRYIDAELIPYTVCRNLENEQIAVTDKRRVDKVPTADVAPVVHAHWIKRVGGYFDCSNCGAVSDWKSPYCPRCPAKMDVEVEK